MKPDASTLYADIIDMAYRPSTTHKHMSMEGRAAQFSSFAALHGHAEAIDEAARHTDADTDLANESRAEISRRTAEAYDAGIKVTVKHFRKDSHKDGGAICTAHGIITKVGKADGTICLDDGTVIPFDAIRDIFSETIDL